MYMGSYHVDEQGCEEGSGMKKGNRDTTSLAPTVLHITLTERALIPEDTHPLFATCRLQKTQPKKLASMPTSREEGSSSSPGSQSRGLSCP